MPPSSGAAATRRRWTAKERLLLNSRHLRLCYVSPRYSPRIGGVELHVAQIATRMAELGHSVEVVTQQDDKGQAIHAVLDGVAVRRFPVLVPSQNFAFSPRLWVYLASNAARFDIIHAHGYHALPALGATLASRGHLVFTPHYHGTGHSPLRSLLHIPYRPLGARIFARAGRVICVSQAEANLVLRHFPRVEGRLTVIPNGIDVHAIQAVEPYRTEAIVVLSVGRLEAYKHVDRVVEAMEHLDERFILKIIGTGPERANLETMVAKAGLARRVEFLGRVEDETLYRWYRTAAAYVTCSDHEAFGMTAWEALAGGAGIVASDIPAHREVAGGREPSVVCLLPKSGSAADIGRAIKRMARRDADDSVTMDILSWDDVTQSTLMVYREVMAGAV